MDLRTARFLKSEVKQTELAKLSGVNQSRISDFERGFTVLRQDEKAKIEKALDCPIDWERRRQ